MHSLLDESCNDDHDIVAVLDLSPSISPSVFGEVKQFIVEFASEFKLGSDAARFGVVSLSTDNVEGVRIQLGEFDMISDFQQSVSNIPPQFGLSSTSEAIEVATEEFIERGRNINVPRTLLLITDKRFNDRQEVLQSSAVARSMGIRLVVIGIGDMVVVDDLEAITASTNAVTHLKDVTAADIFNNVRLSVTGYVCCKNIIFE